MSKPHVVFDNSMQVDGKFDANTNTIHISACLKNRPLYLYSTLIHELTHAFQLELTKNIHNYTNTSKEFQCLQLMKYELKSRDNNLQWNNMELGNRIYINPSIANRFAMPFIQKFDMFYMLQEIERQANANTLLWCKVGGFPQSFINTLEKRKKENISIVRNILRLDDCSP